MDILLDDDKRCVVLTNIIQNLKVFTDNVNIHFNEDHFYIQGMDTSHVSMFDINLDSSWFSKYNSETNLCIGINLNILSKILSTSFLGTTKTCPLVTGIIAKKAMNKSSS